MADDDGRSSRGARAGRGGRKAGGSKKKKQKKTKRGEPSKRSTIRQWPAPTPPAPEQEPSADIHSDLDAARPAKRRRGRQWSKAELSLPPRSLLLTDDRGGIAGLLPRETLVLIERGIARDGDGVPVGVDPRPAQKAFMWLIGRRRGQGLDGGRPHQRMALRLVELLVRACVLDQPGSRELIEELYEVVHIGGEPRRPGTPSPLSHSELPGPYADSSEDDDDG